MPNGSDVGFLPMVSSHSAALGSGCECFDFDSDDDNDLQDFATLQAIFTGIRIGSDGSR